MKLLICKGDEMKKKWYQQKTFWTNAAAAATAVVSLFAPEAYKGDIQSTVLAIFGMGQIFLRQGVEKNKDSQ